MILFRNNPGQPRGHTPSNETAPGSTRPLLPHGLFYNAPMPYPYTTRISNRAKRLQIRIEPCGKIEVVIPRQFDHRQVAGFVAQQHAWIKRTLQRLQQQPATTAQKVPLPEQVSLPALQQQWQITYTTQSRPRLQNTPHQPGSIHIAGRDEQHHHAQLLGWLHEQAKEQLIPWLRTVSGEISLPFQRATVRAQKTRWGSCSAQGNISLNRSLLFLRPELVRYLFIHELCHTVHLNHSPRYWQLVATFEPNYQTLDKSLRRAMQAVPEWARPGYVHSAGA